MHSAVFSPQEILVDDQTHFQPKLFQKLQLGVLFELFHQVFFALFEFLTLSDDFMQQVIVVPEDHSEVSVNFWFENQSNQ